MYAFISLHAYLIHCENCNYSDHMLCRSHSVLPLLPLHCKSLFHLEVCCVDTRQSSSTEITKNTITDVLPHIRFLLAPVLSSTPPSESDSSLTRSYSPTRLNSKSRYRLGHGQGRHQLIQIALQHAETTHIQVRPKHCTSVHQSKMQVLHYS